MSLTKRLSAATAAIAALAIAVPVATASAAPGDLPAPFAPNPNLCLSGLSAFDLGPFGPMGPYGPSGPYGPNGPLANRPNPIGNAAQCGGLITYILRGGTLSSFVQANLASNP